MNISKFIHNSFNFFRKTTPEDIHIRFLLENNKYSKVYELFQNGVNFSKTMEYELSCCFLKFLDNNDDYDKNNLFEIKKNGLPVLKEVEYFFKLLRMNKSLRESFLKIVSEEKLRDKYSCYKSKLTNFYTYIVKNITSDEKALKKNTTDLNIEFFKFMNLVLTEPNKLPKKFSLPEELVFIYLLENSIRKTNELDRLLKIGNLYPCYLLSENEMENSVVGRNNMIEFFKELRYKVKQAKIQKLPIIDLGSDEMQLKMIKSTLKPQILDINQIQNFIDTHNLSEDLKKSLTLITSNLNYLNSESLPSEEQNIVNNIKKNLFKNLNEHDNVMEFLDDKDMDDYKLTYIYMATNLSQILLSHEENKIKSLGQTQQITKARLK